MDPKKKTGGSERTRRVLEGRLELLVAGQIDAERFVFVDECSTNTSLSPLYAWSRKGERARAKAPRN